MRAAPIIYKHFAGREAARNKGKGKGREKGAAFSVSERGQLSRLIDAFD